MKRLKESAGHLWGYFKGLSPIKKALVVIVLILASYVLIFSRSKRSAELQIQTATVTRGTIISTLSESGTVASSSITNVGSPTNGVISEVYVRNGDEVLQGENLFKVKSTATPQEKSQALASLLSAQNSLKSEQAKLNSLQSDLFKANQAFVNGKGVQNPSDQDKSDPVYIEQQADWLQAEADYKNQQGVIAASQASLNTAALNYAATQDSIVTAPISGTVANFSSGIGSNVTASGTTFNNSNTSNQSTSSTPVLVLGNFSDLSIKTPVSEVDISKVKPGQKATITLDAYPDLTYVGVVSSVDTVGANSSGVVTFNAYINFISPPTTIQPGMSATAIIQLEKKDNVLMVPISAVQTDASGTYVREQKNGQLIQIPVTTGISSDTDTEIISGLNEGDTIVVSVVSPSTPSSSTGTSPFSGLNRGFGGGGGGGAVFFRSGGGAGGGGRTGGASRGGGG